MPSGKRFGLLNIKCHSALIDDSLLLLETINPAPRGVGFVLSKLPQRTDSNLLLEKNAPTCALPRLGPLPPATPVCLAGTDLKSRYNVESVIVAEYRSCTVMSGVDVRDSRVPRKSTQEEHRTHRRTTSNAGYLAGGFSIEKLPAGF